MKTKERLENYFDRLWPICRSITGPGYRESLNILSEIMATKRLRYETGRKVFDWTVPKEWIIRDAYLIDPKGVKRANFKVNNLHVVNYSIPYSGSMPLSKLKLHLHSIPKMPDAIPRVISYYKENWGFCMTHRELQSLPDGEYQVLIDSELKPGHVEVAETVLPGQTKKEILFSTYLCHASLANDNLSGPLLTTFLYEIIKSIPKRRYTYRFVILPETIGSICYLSDHGRHLKKHLAAGFVVTCVADKGPFTYKLSRQGNSLADKAVRLVLNDFGEHQIIPFTPAGGSDERQYCSPGFDLPVGSLTRSMYGQYSEYHTSLDNKNYISFEALLESLKVYESMVRALESNMTWRNEVDKCEPQLGIRGLYPSIGTNEGMQKELASLMWVLNFSDGNHDLFSIAERSGMSLALLIDAAEKLAKAKLIIPQKKRRQQNKKKR